MVFYPENESTEYECSFCGKSKDDVGKLIAGLNQIYICDECICVCANIIHPDVMSHDEEVKLRMFDEQIAKAYKDYLMVIRLVTGKKTWNDDYNEDDDDGVL